MAEKRFIATITVYVYGDEKEAFKRAQRICEELNEKFGDTSADVEHFHENDYGQLASREIDIETLK